MENKTIRIGITHGDINGIGYEVILKAFADSTMLELCTPIIYGAPKILAYYRKSLELPTNYHIIQSAEEAKPYHLNIINCCDEELKVDTGLLTPDAGKAAVEALEKAVADYQTGSIDAIVTAPINKQNVQSDTFRFSGHTEYFEHRIGEGKKALMILLRDNFRVALVTGHIPVSQIASKLSTDLVLKKLRLFHYSLKHDFGINNPRIAVLGLNPHAGDNGLLGKEEQEIIVPAIEQGIKEHIQSFGPFPADGFMGAELYQHFDGVLAMYHDQGLIPFKTIAMEEGVNFTAGLPLVRTSPAHGTAYDIAGKGEASESSFRQAIYTAIDVIRNRRREERISAHPLRKQYYDKRDDSDKLKLDTINEED